MAENKAVAAAPIDYERKVKIRLPRSRAANDQDVFVSINERTWLIKRGEEVEVPYCVALLLEDQERALDKVIANQS